MSRGCAPEDLRRTNGLASYDDGVLELPRGVILTTSLHEERVSVHGFDRISRLGAGVGLTLLLLGLPTLFFGVGAAAVALYLLTLGGVALWLLSSRRPVLQLRLTAELLEIKGSLAWGIPDVLLPLEDIHGIEESAGGFVLVTSEGSLEVPLYRLGRRRWILNWLVGKVRHAVARRRAGLVAEGQSPDQPAQIPEALHRLRREVE